MLLFHSFLLFQHLLILILITITTSSPITTAQLSSLFNGLSTSSLQQAKKSTSKPTTIQPNTNIINTFNNNDLKYKPLPIQPEFELLEEDSNINTNNKIPCKELTGPIRVGRGINLSVNNWCSFISYLNCMTGRGGKWLDEWGIPQPRLTPRSITHFSRCGSLNHVLDRELNPGLYYGWHPPSNCKFKTLGRLEICKILGGRNILIVGDSTQATFHRTLLSQMLPQFMSEEEDHDQFDPCPGHCICCIEQEKHPTDNVLPSKVMFIRNDYLSVTRTQHIPDGIKRNVELFEWLHYVTNDTILILNRGAHYVETPIVIRELRQTLTTVRNHARGALTLFRSTHGGHDPLFTGHRLVPLLRPQLYEGHPEWRWNDIPKQNRDIKRLIYDEFPGIVYLDITYLMALRPDNHIDGLHYCIPGPVDWWVPFMYNALYKMEELKMNMLGNNNVTSQQSSSGTTNSPNNFLRTNNNKKNNKGH
jgi:hypothetical protein